MEEGSNKKSPSKDSGYKMRYHRSKMKFENYDKQDTQEALGGFGFGCCSCVGNMGKFEVPVLDLENLGPGMFTNNSKKDEDCDSMLDEEDEFEATLGSEKRMDGLSEGPTTLLLEDASAPKTIEFAAANKLAKNYDSSKTYFDIAEKVRVFSGKVVNDWTEAFGDNGASKVIEILSENQTIIPDTEDCYKIDSAGETDLLNTI